MLRNSQKYSMLYSGWGGEFIPRLLSRTCSTGHRYDGPIVISGISGRFPKASNVKELTEKLLAGEDLTSETSLRWRNNMVPKRFGFLDCCHKFDASFFGMTRHQAENTDPQTRLLLEVAFEAIIDAGLNPTFMRGSRTGVFSAAYGGEALDYINFHGNPEDDKGYLGIYSAGFMIPSRLSFALDLHGPNILINTACSSSLSALETAVEYICAGKCDAAIVTGSAIHLNPQACYDIVALKAVSMDGHCRSFDQSANGFVRSEACVAVLLQKEKDALRNYSRIVNILSNTNGFQQQGLTHSSALRQTELLRSCYAQAGIETQQVSYVEAHGTGTPIGDTEELQALSNIFCHGTSRNKPLLIGSVKTNLGHTETASGLCGVSKVIGAIQTGVIPPNLYFTKPKPEDEHLFDGSMEVVQKATKFENTYVGVSSFGLGGTNSHMILQPGPVHDPKTPHELPILVPCSGRSHEHVQDSLIQTTERARNPEYLYLLHRAFHRAIPGHSYCGINLLKPSGKQSQYIATVEDSTRPVWVIFPGMGSQWKGMGREEMKIEPFAESLQRSESTLKNVGVNLDQLLNGDNDLIFTDIRCAFLAITAVQIALWDTLRELNVEADGLIGHSTGEALCAYADGCVSAEEALLMGEARGRAFKESRKVIGGMASIAGWSADEVKARLTPDVELACNNAAHNVTIAGELVAVEKFVKQVKSEGKFATMVNSCGFAAHCSHVQDAAELVKKYTNDIISTERPISARWISTSIPEDQWSSPMAKFLSAEYINNNVRAPVLFYEALRHVPEKSIVVEVSPNGFFQTLLKESLSKDCTHVAPMSKRVEDKLGHFYQSIGQLYLAGLSLNLDKLYPAVALPVSSNTPSLSPLVQWDHSQSWKTCQLEHPLEYAVEVKFDLEDPKFAYLTGHKIDSKVIVPATRYLTAAWAQLGYTIGTHYLDLPVQFDNVSLKRGTVLGEQSDPTLLLSVNATSGAFHFASEGDIFVQGRVSQLAQDVRFDMPAHADLTSSDWSLSKDDVYKEFKLRGYNYSGLFQGIEKADPAGRWADVAWNDNWTSFLDTLLQTLILATTSRNLMVPVQLEKVMINPQVFRGHLSKSMDEHGNSTVRVVTLPNQGRILAPGIEIKGVQPQVIPHRMQQSNLAYEEVVFRPYFESSSKDKAAYFWELVDLIDENNFAKNFKTLDVFTKKETSSSKMFAEVVSFKLSLQNDLTMLTLASEAEKMSDEEKALGTLVTKSSKDQLVPDEPADLIFLDDASLLPALEPSLKPSGFILLHSHEHGVSLHAQGLRLLSHKISQDQSFSLFRKVPCQNYEITHVSVDSEDYSWIPQLQKALQGSSDISRIYVTSQASDSGILGFVKCLLKENDASNVRCVFDPQHSLNLKFFNPCPRLQDILDRDVVFNVVQDNSVGSFRFLPLSLNTTETAKNVKEAYVSPMTPGDLSSLRWIELPPTTTPIVPPRKFSPLLGSNVEDREKVYKVAYVGLNFRDVLLATRAIPIEPHQSYNRPYLGFEFSGYDQDGRRVMGITRGQSLATSVRCDPRLVWDVPDRWSLEQAASVLLVYSTVLYAFHSRARLRAGQTVLIHAGTGGVGQAAISVALAHGCTVFTTVSSPEKRELVKQLFPQVQDDHIGNSRDTSFEQQFMELTDGCGVDVALNSLAGDKLQATLRCLAINGKFLEIGVFDAYQNSLLEMGPFLKNIDFNSILLYHVMETGLGHDEDLHKLLNDGIQTSVVKPLPTRVFERDQVEDAFRFMAAGKHTGKLVIKVRDQDDAPTIQAVGKCYFSSDKVYLIIGGLGGLGLEVANWLVERGARHLVLTSRSGMTSGYQRYCLQKWKNSGVTVKTSQIPFSHPVAAAAEFMKANGDMIGGIFNSALVLKDDHFACQTPETFQYVASPKVMVTKTLDELSRKYCPNLDYFVVFSSAACGRGTPEQTNYGWANSVMERICETRIADGLHGLAIQWGIISEVGYVAEKLLKNVNSSAAFYRTLPQNVDSCLHVMDIALQQRNAVVSSLVIAEKGRRKVEAVGIQTRVKKIFGIKDTEKLRPNLILSQIGMDSIVGLELKQMIERDYGIRLTKERLISLTVEDLKLIENGTFDLNPNVRNIKEVDLMANKPFQIYSEGLVKLNKGHQNGNVFIVHGMGTGAGMFSPLAQRLNKNVYGLQLTDAFEWNSVQNLAAGYIQEIKAIDSSGPYTIMGFSAGAVIAFEMAQQLQDSVDEVPLLVFLDGSPCFAAGGEEVAKDYILKSINRSIRMPEEQLKQFEASLKGKPQEDIVNLMHTLSEANLVGNNNDHINAHTKFIRMILEYKPWRSYGGKVVLLQAMDTSASIFGTFNEDYNVSNYCEGQVSRYQVIGDHWTFLEEEHVEESAEILRGLLETR